MTWAPTSKLWCWKFKASPVPLSCIQSSASSVTLGLHAFHHLSGSDPQLGGGRPSPRKCSSPAQHAMTSTIYYYT
jgi:hypothetical protein